MLRTFTVDSAEAAASAVSAVRRSAAVGVSPSGEIEDDVAAVVAEVRRRGDEALVEYTRRFDGIDLGVSEIEVAPDDLDAAVETLSGKTRRALESAACQLRRYFEAQYASVAGEFEFRRGGFDIRFLVRPVRTAGIYVPGGRYRYPSTVLMTVIPAVVAGVEEVVVCTPPAPTGSLDPIVAASARLAGADRVFVVGGVQAIAAMAYGTESVPRVDLIAGPGNAYVACAKRLVFGEVGIDALAGPSELVVVAGDAARWDLVAVDLAAQAEHGPGGLTIAAVFSSGAACSLVEAVTKELDSDGRPELRHNLEAGGAVAVCGDEDAALAVIEEAAPEHVQVMLDDEGQGRAFAERISSAGAVFVGTGTPAAFGDYVAGPSHVLPTGGSARFSSGLGVYSFLRFRNSVRAGEVSNDLATAADELAACEGMVSHRRSLEVRRLGKPPGEVYDASRGRGDPR